MKKQAFFYFIKFTKKHFLLFLVFAISFFSYIGMTLFVPSLYREFIDEITKGNPVINVIIFIAIMYFVAILAEEGLKILRDFLSQTFSWKLNQGLRNDLFKNILEQDMEFFSQNSVGELVECVDGDSLEISRSISNFLLNVVVNIFILLGILFIIFTVSIKIGFIFSLFSVISFFSMLKLSESGTSSFTKVRKTSEAITSLVTESIYSYKEIHTLSAEKKVLAKINLFHKDLFKHLKDSKLKSIFTLELNNFILLIEKCVLFFSLYIFYKNNTITIGEVFMIYSYFSLLSWPIEMLAVNSTAFHGLSANINRIFELLNKKSKIKFGKKKMDQSTYSIEFDNVSFSYEGRNKVLDSVSFTIPSGKIVGLQGRTGGGKTTLTRLLLGLYSPSSGCILLNGVPIQEFSQKELTDGIGYISQTITLFYASIRDNIRMFDESITDEQINKALKECGMYEKILALPGALDYVVTDDASNFSSGETQLLACARLFLRERKIIILDESTSNLDKAEEEKIIRSFNKLVKGKTAILISHKAETLKDVDLKFIIEDGKIISENNGGKNER